MTFYALDVIITESNPSAVAAGHRWASFRFRWIFNEKIKKEIFMAVVIRLQRHGGKKRPYYHIVALDSRIARDSGNTLETLGKYDPMQPKDSDKRVIFNAEKVKAWLAKGAKPSDRVYKFLANAGMLPKKEHPAFTKKNQPSEKTLQKLKDREAKLAAAKEAETAATATPAVEETPAEAPVEAPAEPAPLAEEAPAETPAAE